MMQQILQTYPTYLNSDYNERVLNFEKEFNENARGMGFEVLSPIENEKVKNYKVTFEWASRLNVREI